MANSATLSTRGLTPLKLTSEVIDFWYPGWNHSNFFDYTTSPTPEQLAAEPAFPQDWIHRWFMQGVTLDPLVTEKFGPAWDELVHNEQLREKFVADMEATIDGTLAAILFFDQFPRHLHRGKAAAFQSDPFALKISKDALFKGYYDRTCRAKQFFLLMPHTHSEKMEDGQRALEIIMNQRAMLPQDSPSYQIASMSVKSYQEHLDILKKFGRYPHRNGCLGRQSTEEEVSFLEGGGARFGQ
ncbi:DUF924-domain-containing protein [Gonapodya prolifera JEL478]|uniref:DUF924-domain-containing protein n=1 Tax=Gonapodya prolifera (strain JEL478) TaxID=1344416 RepID=A0A139AFY5_GONPJ|nr:DUF924-domain-containing protein [Gonapodya prolifera JEL478]|eukprot:KXS15706.1 DUF924-domain-containing protein [Gonapodya prolifera JEL478]